jgi:hypothetical protein
MSIQHAIIDDPDIHEPKGISTAAANTVYVATGAGTGAWTAAAGSSFGEIYITAGATTQTLSAASAYATLNPAAEWASGVSSGVTLDPTNGQFTVSVAGVYQFNFWINFTTAAIAAGTQYYFKYAINGVVGTQTDTVTKITNGADKLDTFASALVTLAAGDIVTIQVAGDGTSSSTNITPTEAAFSALLLKVT